MGPKANLLLSAALLFLGAGCGEDTTALKGTLTAEDYRTVRASQLAGEPVAWVEIPQADPKDNGRYVEMELSTFGSEELLQGMTAGMRTLASRILFENAEKIEPYFAPDFTGPRLDGQTGRLKKREFVAGLREHLAGFDRIRDLRFKEVAAEAIDERPRELRMDMKLTILGSVGEVMRKDELRFEAEGAPIDGLWRFTRWGPVTIETRTSDTLHFVERTEVLGFEADFDDVVVVPGGSLGASLYVNGGLAVVDYDRDEDLDVYVTRYGENLLYENDGGRFSEVGLERGVADEGHGHGALFIELDGDGDLDLYVANNTDTVDDWPSTVYWNESGKYARAGADSGSHVEGYGSAVAAADYDRDGDLDVFVGRYSDVSKPHSYSAARDARLDVLLNNGGDRRFTDEAEKAGIRNTGWTLAATWADYDADGDPDLYISNDFGPNELHVNRGDGTFEEVASRLNVADLGNGMGANWVDYDNDGDLDLYSVNMYSTAAKRVLVERLENLNEGKVEDLKKMARGNTLLRNDGDSFTDVSAEAGCQAAGWSWGTEWFDYDSDGDLDMLIANGYWSASRSRDL